MIKGNDMFPFLSNIKAIIIAVCFVGIATAGYLVQRHINVQADTMASLQRSEEVLKVSLNQAVNQANHNATLYTSAQEKHRETLVELQSLQAKINVIEDTFNKDEEHINVQINTMDKESFEYKCYNMEIPSSVVQRIND